MIRNIALLVGFVLIVLCFVALVSFGGWTRDFAVIFALIAMLGWALLVAAVGAVVRTVRDFMNRRADRKARRAHMAERQAPERRDHPTLPSQSVFAPRNAETDKLVEEILKDYERRSHRRKPPMR